MDAPPPGRLLARGTCRMLRHYDFACVTEFVPTPGLRVDVMALGPRGDLWIVECKSSRTDFTSDRKWQGYLDWCDRFYWAVDAAFPDDLLPADTGLIRADGFGAAILREAPAARLPGARRAALIRRLARHAAFRLQGLDDPPPGG
ncbi:MAG: MmcB family DNA repair protein [Rhodobacteraceae bacterium]|jgi:hypothetical protein|nr:MmcB family DNA repair protein [Paracoccaceae bacterium]MBL4558819.1 MmcB family DNA repair protein [Paracoccaceae bacterium]HBG98129.1 DNA repair protein MmcB-related protein [Paracoccaceae bacterium]